MTNPEGVTLSLELARRQSKTAKVVAVFRDAPRQWLIWALFSDLVGERAYRTRISNAKKRFEQEGGTVESRTYTEGPRIITEYRYLPQKPLGRDAGVPVLRSWTTDGPFTPPFQLTAPDGKGTR